MKFIILPHENFLLYGIKFDHRGRKIVKIRGAKICHACVAPL